LRDWRSVEGFVEHSRLLWHARVGGSTTMTERAFWKCTGIA
jgi:hypothetical protein